MRATDSHRFAPFEGENERTNERGEREKTNERRAFEEEKDGEGGRETRVRNANLDHGERLSLFLFVFAKKKKRMEFLQKKDKSTRFNSKYLSLLTTALQQRGTSKQLEKK